MTALRRLIAALDARIPRSLSRDQIVVRGLGLLATLVALALTGAPVPVQVLGAVAAVAAALVPEPYGSSLNLATLLVAWVMGLRSAAQWQTLAVALLVLVEHTCQVVSTGAPPQARLGRALLRRAVARAGAVAVPTVLVWLGLRYAPALVTVPVPVVVAALAVLLAGAWWLTDGSGAAPRERRRRGRGRRSTSG